MIRLIQRLVWMALLGIGTLWLGSCEDPRLKLPPLQRLDRQFTADGFHYVLTQAAESFDLNNNGYGVGVYQQVIPQATKTTPPSPAAKNRVRLFLLPANGLPKQLEEIPSSIAMPCEVDLTHFADSDDNGKPELFLDCPDVTDQGGQSVLLELSGKKVHRLAKDITGRFTRRNRPGVPPMLLAEASVCLLKQGDCTQGGTFQVPKRWFFDGTDYRTPLTATEDDALLAEALSLERSALEVLKDTSACPVVWRHAAKAALLRILGGQVELGISRYQDLMGRITPRCGDRLADTYDLPTSPEDLPAWKSRRKLDSLLQP